MKVTEKGQITIPKEIRDAIGIGSATALSESAETGPLCINPVIYSEVSIWFSTIEDLEDALPPEGYRREPIPWAEAFLAGKAFLNYKRNQHTKTTTLPDLVIGAHAAIAERQLLTRDVSR